MKRLILALALAGVLAGGLVLAKAETAHADAPPPNCVVALHHYWGTCADGRAISYDQWLQIVDGQHWLILHRVHKHKVTHKRVKHHHKRVTHHRRVHHHRRHHRIHRHHKVHVFYGGRWHTLY